MSQKHPVVAVTGSSGAGTSTVREAFAHVFAREGIRAQFVEGDSFFRYDRDEMARVIGESLRTATPVSHFGPETNDFARLEALFRDYGASGGGSVRHYVKDPADVTAHGRPAGTFTEWESIAPGSDLLFYEGLHGGVVASTWTRRRMSPSHNPRVIERRKHLGEDARRGVDVAQHVDLLIGVAPTINLEWIQKIDRDCSRTGCTIDEVTTTILRRMRDYVHYIVPQFSLTDVNFQRVPLVDTSNPFIARDVPTQDESMVVIRFREPKRFNILDLLDRIDGARMSRPNTMVVPGGEMSYAMEVVCTPVIHRLMEQRAA